MRAVVQRVHQARVIVDSETIGAIGPGLVVFLGVGRDDDSADSDYLAGKIAGLMTLILLWPLADSRRPCAPLLTMTVR